MRSGSALASCDLLGGAPNVRPTLPARCGCVLTALWVLAGCAPSDAAPGDADMADASPEDASVGDGGIVDATDCPACADGNPCTRDVCADDASCSWVPIDSRCGGDERCAAGYGCVPVRCDRDQHCDDGRWCTGTERCDPESSDADPVTGCVAAEARDCDDGFSCTEDICDDVTRACRRVPRDEACDDGIVCTHDACEPAAGAGDGCTHVPDDSVCTALDWCTTVAVCDPVSDCLAVADRACNDGDPCTTDACDGTARACTHVPWDFDGDGSAAPARAGATCAGDDCDDADPYAFPGATEVCDGADDDCDGVVDEACDTPGDTCDVPTVLAPPAWPVEVRGSFERLSRDRDIPCLGFGRGGAADAFYAIDIDEPSDVRIDVPAEASNFAIAVTANACLSGNFDDLCVQRWMADPAIQPPTFLIRGVRPNADGSPRRIYIAVAESQPPTHRQFRFSVDVTPASPTDCDVPIAVRPETHVLGFFGATDSASYATSCAASVSGQEHVYRVTADRSTLRAQLWLSTFTAGLSVREGACSGAAIGCARGATTDRRGALLERTVRVGGEYVVVVDGAASDSDSYVLRIQ